MTLRDVETNNSYNTSKDDLINHFFVPLLQHSKFYDRGVGYFSSGWLFESFIGMADFAKNGGKARWITSPILSKEDWDALVLGDQAKHNAILKEALAVTIDELKEKIQHDTLVAFAWMVADGIIEFKLAKPRNKLTSEFHAKVGIFTDPCGESVSFDGSYNDGINGLHNYESIKVFRSWDATSDYVTQEKAAFEKLWNDEDPNVSVFDIPDAAKAHILKLREQNPRPYPNRLKELVDLIEITIPSPHMPPDVLLRDYQEEAVNAWFSNDCRGTWEMATGTGKTITALTAAVRLFEAKKRLFTIVLCPYIHLGEQWRIEAERFGFQPVLVAESKAKWQENVAKLLRDFSSGRLEQASIITTNASFQRGVLMELLNEYDTLKESLIIADEVHHCGSMEMLKVLPQKVPYRLGLSATPIREYDESGSDALLEYFGEVVFTFDLAKAIEAGFLTPYNYFPTPVNLAEEEFDEYIILSSKLQRMHPDPKAPMSDAALLIAIQRARVLNNAVSKISWLDDNIEEYGDLVYTLFYSGDQIFDDVLKLLGVTKSLLVHAFTHVQTLSERSRILQEFSEKKLQALVAMKCLDEGVDVPPTRTAYFLASSSVSREFVQRRGRILRNSPGKTHAYVYDLISIPPERYLSIARSDENYSVVRSALRRELTRVKEFSKLAENKHTSMVKFVSIANRFDLLDLI